ncbi:hypothetical protein IKQ26_01910, partial [bacterium]|nr:hypothetical protein [bacterium]
MKISAQIMPNIRLSFKSHKKEAKEATDIMRRAQLTFPMVSATRALTLYDIIDKHPRQEKFLDDLQEEIFMMRDEVEFKQKLAGYTDNPFKAFIESIQKRKKGNCLENAVIAAAGLYANGYSADVVSLYLDHSFINKKTGRVEYKEGGYLDHAFTITDMGKKNQKIVLDPWCGYCGDWKEISPKYHKLFDNDDKVIRFTEENRKEFAERLKNECSPNDISDY